METQAAIGLGFGVAGCALALGIVIYLITTSDTCQGRRTILLPAALQRAHFGGGGGGKIQASI